MNAILRNFIFTNPESILDNLENIKNNDNLYMEAICKADNDCLNEIILSICENQFNTYFESIPELSSEDLEQYFPKYFEYKKIHDKVNPTFILFDLSLNLFKNCSNFLERIYNNRKEKKDEKINNKKLCILYCISYVKMYLYKSIYFNHTINEEFDFEEIHKAIERECNK